MVERLRRGRFLLAAGAIAALILSTKLLAGDDRPDPCSSPRTAPPAEKALMPAGLSLAGIATVTRVLKERRNTIVLGTTSKPLNEVTVQIQDAVVAAGYRPGGMDNEGFEAEVFFTSGTYAAGQARLRASACAGRWDLYLVLLDRNAVPARTTTRTTAPRVRRRRP